MKKELEARWWYFLSFALFAGILLRMLFVEDMEYKEDEEYNFTQTQLIGTTQPWPWYGIPSGVYLVNPGMSIWVFTVLAKIFGIHSPTSLAHAVQLFALLGMAMVLPFALKWVRDSAERKVWLWALALSMVNPFLVLYQRKLWPEPFLPFFVILTLMGWWRRSTFGYALIWGMIGAWLGQIHMSGFFFSFALFLWTGLFDPLRLQKKSPQTHWKGWLLGSVVGALPLIPWAIYVFQNPVGEKMSAGWNEIIQLKYWAFWITDPTGLTLGNPLGLLRGTSNWTQISDFVRYPLWEGQPTFVVGIFHAVALISTFLIYLRGISSRIQLSKARQWKLRTMTDALIGRSSNTLFVQNAALIGCGLLMTATGVIIRRYYMAITFPLEFIFLIRLADPTSRIGKRLLMGLWIAELVISLGFVGYIHTNQGATQGDYGEAYHLRHSETPKQTQ
jgi:hypothetical protein